MRNRRAVTLLELLIVMTIMLMVTAAAIPIMMPALQNRRMREAARLTSSFISGARARAIESGHPVGVMFERFNGLPMAMQLSYVEVPPPYAGDLLTSKVNIAVAGVYPTQTAEITGFATGDNLWIGQLRYGDRVKLDFKGAEYTLSSQATLPDPKTGEVVAAPSGAVHWYLVGSSPINLPPTYAAGVAFQIIRQPIRSSATPLQLPDTTVVDLMQSGMGASGVFPPPVPFNPIVMFSPNGTVDSVAAPSPIRPSGPLFLLIGRRDLMADVTPSGTDENLFDPKPTSQHLSNFWVSVAHQTGQVSVSENAQNAADVVAARVFAQSGQSAGGR